MAPDWKIVEERSAGGFSSLSCGSRLSMFSQVHHHREEQGTIDGRTDFYSLTFTCETHFCFHVRVFSRQTRVSFLVSCVKFFHGCRTTPTSPVQQVLLVGILQHCLFITYCRRYKLWSLCKNTQKSRFIFN